MFRGNNTELIHYYLQKSWMVFAFNPIQDGPFRSCSGWWGGPQRYYCLKSATHPAMMKIGTLIPYLKKIQKIYKSCDTPLELCRYQHFSGHQFCSIKKCRYRLYFYLFLILLTFLSLQIFFNKHGYNLMMSAKMASLGSLKIKLF